VFVLYEIEDLGLREIAQSLDVPLQTVYSRLLSARREVEARVRADVTGPAARLRQGGR
jgi:DNA-directed RNA polymerase specialized sigma24 family protein